jgi:hypothetical protein
MVRKEILTWYRIWYPIPTQYRDSIRTLFVVNR